MSCVEWNVIDLRRIRPLQVGACVQTMDDDDDQTSIKMFFLRNSFRSNECGINIGHACFANRSNIRDKSKQSKHNRRTIRSEFVINIIPSRLSEASHWMCFANRIWKLIVFIDVQLSHNNLAKRYLIRVFNVFFSSNSLSFTSFSLSGVRSYMETLKKIGNR